MNAEYFATYLATSTLDLFNTADYNPDRLTLGVSVRDLWWTYCDSGFCTLTASAYGQVKLGNLCGWVISAVHALPSSVMLLYCPSHLVYRLFMHLWVSNIRLQGTTLCTPVLLYGMEFYGWINATDNYEPSNYSAVTLIRLRITKIANWHPKREK